MGQAQAKVTDLTQRVKDTARQVRQQATTAAGTGRQQLQARTPEGVKRAAATGPGRTGRRRPSRPVCSCSASWS
jgi:hypothetical protein